ncbi:MAG: tRNA (adenine-N1)-methyltransferase [Armatimonadota bacterium]|nr:tRNA (adenine-N1)-methyltransferase [Armatimonadota bacterium]MDR5697225.1 tRNA (adenine-N1)-methyltransferase [Armatimonadota bacterium]
MRTGPLQAGDLVLLIDRRRRSYPITLQAGKVQDLRGRLAHDDLIGRDEGTFVRTSAGERFLAVRPTLADYVLEMPRGATIVYPKDLAQILMAADVYPGATVVEAGTGSGSLTMALLRAVGPQGKVFTYDVRADFQRRALRNVEAFLGPQDRLVARIHDVYEGIPDAPAERIILDLPEPWRVVEHAAATLPAGGIFASYVPTVLQAHRTSEALRASGAFALIETTETLVRPWNLEGQSVRPVHRMVAHTGFVTVARRVAG